MQRSALSTAHVARLFSVTETTVKRWADEGTLICQKTPGGHRRFMIRDVVEFADRNNFTPAGALELAGPDSLSPAIQLAVLSRDFGVLVDAFAQKALSPEKAGLFAYLSYLYEHRIHLWEIYDRVIQPGMVVIGNRWAEGNLDVGDEHRASYATLVALARLQTQIIIKPVIGKVAVCACVGEEQHHLGLRCAAYLAESEGWTIHYMGARTPLQSLVAAVRGLKPDLVCLSTTGGGGKMLTEEALEDLSRVARECGALLVVGGSGARGEMEEQGIWIIPSAKGLLDLLTELKRTDGARRK
jgi:methanogenic corrinoid protein MtbC1